MSECPLRTDTGLLTRLTSHNPLIPLPNAQLRNPKIAHAPKRNHGLTAEGKQVSALANMLALISDMLVSSLKRALS